ncbi:hypothetical protein ACFVS2_20540 [Brevibacillus sp. NPDC058079]|uniref:hypothetical protein n=1 Tax=Brevibacillus sp. NPDC058079 TaxID=3346330 RepID=UPI0036F0A46D
MLKRDEIVVGGIYSNGKKDRFYSERMVLNVKNNERYPKMSIIEYEVVRGYSSHQLIDSKGSMTVESFCKWAEERLDTRKVIPIHSFVFECNCGNKLEAGFHLVGQTVEEIDCDCGLSWTIQQPRCVQKHMEEFAQ